MWTNLASGQIGGKKEYYIHIRYLVSDERTIRPAVISGLLIVETCAAQMTQGSNRANVTISIEHDGNQSKVAA